MRISISILFITTFFTNELIAQSKSERLYISMVDSIIKERDKVNDDLAYKEFTDTLNFSFVKMYIQNNKLTRIYVVEKSIAKPTEITHNKDGSSKIHFTPPGLITICFEIINDSLVYVAHSFFYPDIRSMPPSSVTNYAYFKKDKQIHNSIYFALYGNIKGLHNEELNWSSNKYKELDWHSAKNKDYIKEFNYYKELYNK